jgi:hypothetical protein
MTGGNRPFRQILGNLQKFQAGTGESRTVNVKVAIRRDRSVPTNVLAATVRIAGEKPTPYYQSVRQFVPTARRPELPSTLGHEQQFQQEDCFSVRPEEHCSSTKYS